MTQKLIVYEAASPKPYDLVMTGLTVLVEIEAQAFVEVKEKYLPLGLKQANRNPDHPFWQNEGIQLWEDIRKAVNERIEQGFWFGQHPEVPQVVGIFQMET